MSREFVSPDFILNSSPEIIQERMMAKLPSDISDMPADFPYDFTMPTAVEISRFMQHTIVRTLMLMNYEWAWGEWLDIYGKMEKVIRKVAVKATGVVTVKAKTGTIIPVGTVFCTEGNADAASLEYETTEEVVISSSGSAEIPIAAVTEGAIGNTAPGTIVLQRQINKDIESVMNMKPILGGADIETDDEYRERIDEKVKETDVSYVGNDSDYVRWAKEVPGVATAVTDGAWNGPGTVKVVISGQAGAPVSEDIINAVYNHIASPDDPEKRLLPAGGITLTVETVKLVKVTFSVEIELDEGASVEMVKKAFLSGLENQYMISKKDKKIRYTELYALLSNTDGVADFGNFKVNGAVENIAIDTDDYPSTTEDDLTFTERGVG